MRSASADGTSTRARTRVTFNVLQGLVFAIDTKDRYTKRHSEDVARYAVFLAGQVGLEHGAGRGDPDGGLLHDVGKIGDPRHDPAQARGADRRGVRRRQAARRPRRIDRPRPRRDRDRADRHPPPPRALGRQGLPRRPRRRGDPARRPDPGRGRRLLGDDDDPSVSQGALRRGGAAPPRRRGWESARRATRRARSSKASSTSRTRRAPTRSRGSRCGCRRTASPDRAPCSRWRRGLLAVAALLPRPAPVAALLDLWTISGITASSSRRTRTRPSSSR